MVVMALAITLPSGAQVNGGPLKRAAKPPTGATDKIGAGVSDRPDRKGSVEMPRSRAAATSSIKGLTMRNGFVGSAQWLSDRNKAPRRIMEDSTPLVGCLIYTGNPNTPFGVYEVPTNGSSDITLLSSSSTAQGGGVIFDGKYYTVDYYKMYGTFYVTVFVYDIETWELEGVYDGDVSIVANDMAYDPVTGKVYGSFYNDNGDGFVFGTFDPVTLTRTAICDLPTFWYGVAADKNGVLYAIATDGSLYTVDKTTGETTLVGDTGLKSQYATSAAIDIKTGRFYYALNNDATAALYEINPQTAEATLVTEYSYFEEFSGLCFPVPEAEDGAPAIVENLTADFTGGSLSGNIVFDTPSTTFDGTAAQGELTYTVTANGEVVATGMTAFAQTGVTVPVSVEQTGQYEFIVTVTNSVGRSPQAKMSLWVGNDMPKALAGASLSYADGWMTLTWEPVSEAVNGGYFDPAEVTYTVVRYPGGVEVASGISECTFSEEMAEPEAFTVYYYTVTVNYKGETTKATASNKTTLGTLVLPYLNDFSNGYDSFDGYTLLNLNNDGNEWEVTSGGVVYMDYNKTADMDAWLITPPVRLEEGKLYTLSFDAASYDNRYAERVEAFLGTSPSLEGMTRQIIGRTEVCGSEFVTLKQEITVETTGNYYFGIHGCSDMDKFRLYIDNVAISAGSYTGSPAAATELTVTPGALGALTATIEFVAPAENIIGGELTALEKVELLRDGELINTFNAPAPGARLSYTDNTPAEGVRTYSVVAYNEYGNGIAAETSAFIGVNVPGAVPSATIVETATQGEVTVSWEAPVIDINGYPLDPSVVTYTILDGNRKVIAENITGLSHTFYALPTGMAQDFVYYAVFASTRAGMNSDGYALTDMIPIGEPYTLPVMESFADGSITGSYIWGIDAPAGSTVEWRPYTDASGVPSQDGDNGCIGSMGSYKGEMASLFTGKIRIADEANPALTFYYYAFDNGANIVEAQVNSGEGFVTLASYVAYSTVTGWVKAVVPLSDYKGKDIQVGFRTTIQTHKATIIDNIRIVDLPDYSLTAAGISVPEKMNMGEEYAITVKVENGGAKQAEGYSVELYRNGAAVQTKDGAALASGETALVEFRETPTAAYDETLEYYAVVKYAADIDDSDNTTGKATATVVRPDYPTVSDLAGEQTQDGVKLTWSKPEIPEGPVTESFEGYESFVINPEGDWSFIDADGVKTYGIQSISFPNSGQPMAYIVFDGSNPDFGTSLAAHSGDKYMASFVSEGAQNDDWMISPELDGSAQTVSFYAKSYTDSYGNESFEFYYSATGKEKADFVKLGGDDAVPTDWTEYSYEVPEGAKYFAIRCTSNDCFIFLVDDVTYIPRGLVLTGYNVYRDGEMITDSPLDTTSYTDADTKAGQHSYFVTAVYDRGESKASNVVLVDVTVGIGEQMEKAVRIAADDNTIVVSNAAGKSIGIYTADGKTVYSGEGAEVTRVRVNSGVYIVKVGTATLKAVVR